MSPKLMEALESRCLLSTLPAGFAETQVAKINTSVAATMAFAPDGRLFVGDTRNGQIRVIKNGALLSTPAVTLNSDRASERGINGIAFAPNFASAPAGQKYVFIYYTKPDPAKPNVNPSNAKNRLSRFTLSSTSVDQLNASSELVLIDNISATAGNHNGGALHFGADGMLYLAVGEAAVPSDAQRLSTYNGKVLRLNAMNPSSLVPADNPYVNTSGALPLIWAIGFRNPFTGAMKPGTSTLYINDVGAAAWEEINQVQKGKNYGWPSAEGNSSNPAYTNPLFSYAHNGSDVAITGGAFYDKSLFPSAYSGKYFFGDYILRTIWTLDEATKQRTAFATGTHMVVDIDVNPIDGSLWYLGLTGEVQKITHTQGNRAPTAVASASTTSGLAPLAVMFDGSKSSDPDNDLLSYSWSFGDGSTGSGRTITRTYTGNGTFAARLTVSDGRGGSHTSAPISIVVGNQAPVPKIEAPTAGALYNGGSVITFRGSATDPEDGALGASRFDWSVVFHHDTHTHPFRTSIPGVTSGTFTIPKVGEVAASQFYRVTLTVTDSRGLKRSTSVDIKPRKSTFTLASNIAGLKLSLDSAAARTAPFGTVGVVGMTRSITAAATQTLNGKTYQFVSWSDGKAASHSFDIPAANTTYTATYREVSGTTTQTFRALSDATVRDGSYAARNFGSAGSIDAKRGGSGWTRWSYLKFDLNRVSASSIGRVVLRLYGKLDNPVTKNIPMDIFPVASTSWTEGTITWNNKPASGATALGRVTVIDTTARWYEVDLTPYVKQQRSAGKIAVAFALKAAVSAQPLAIFNSDEAASNKPQLVITRAATASALSAVSTPAPIPAPIPAPTPAPLPAPTVRMITQEVDSAWQRLERDGATATNAATADDRLT